MQFVDPLQLFVLLSFCSSLLLLQGVEGGGQEGVDEQGRHIIWNGVRIQVKKQTPLRNTNEKVATAAAAEKKEETREAKSLRNTFPFNARNSGHQGHHHGEHSHHAQAHQHQQTQQALPSRASRQEVGSNDVALDIGTIAAAGERCIDKVIMTEETEYDDVIECKHSYTERCHTTYKTDYDPQQEEECDENFKKSCFIEFKKRASKEKVKFCYQPLVKNCNVPGPVECTTEYQTACSTRYHEHEVQEDVPDCIDDEELKCVDETQGYTTEQKCSRWPIRRCSLAKQTVKKFTPETTCEKIPFELCGPSSCPVEAGPEQCQDKEETFISEVPEEVCNLEPQRECKHVTKLVPKLKPFENCLDVPKEVCVRSRANPRRVAKPIVKKWCYTPTPESGLGFGSSLSQGNQNQGRVTPRPRPTPQAQGCVAGYPVNHCPSRANNGRCDPECDTPACGYDANECIVTPPPPPVFTPPQPASCARGYPASHCPGVARNNQCNPECNTAACNYDGGDCRPKPTPPPRTPPPTQRSCARGYPASHCPGVARNNQCNPECNTAACNYDGGDCRPKPTSPPRTPPPTQRSCARGYPASHCPGLASNGVCNPECNNSACRFDGGDCKKPELPTNGYLPPPPSQQSHSGYGNHRGGRRHQQRFGRRG